MPSIRFGAIYALNAGAVQKFKDKTALNQGGLCDIRPDYLPPQFDYLAQITGDALIRTSNPCQTGKMEWAFGTNSAGDSFVLTNTGSPHLDQMIRHIHQGTGSEAALDKMLEAARQAGETIHVVND